MMARARRGRTPAGRQGRIFGLAAPLALILAMPLPPAAAAAGSFAAPDAPPVQAAGAEGVVVDAVALDYSSMLRSRHGPEDEANATRIPLAGVSVVGVVFEDSTGTSRTLEARTDATGSLHLELGPVPPGHRLYLAVPPGQGGAGSSPAGWYAKPWDPSSGEALDEIRFYRVAAAPDALVQRIDQVVTVGGEDSAFPGELLVVQSLLVQNLSFDVWLGEDGFARESGSFHVPIPRGMEIVEVSVNGKPAKGWRRRHMPHGGDSIVWMEPIAPSIPPEPGLFIRALFRGAYESGQVYDVGSHLEYATDQYGLYLQEGELHYVAPESGVALQDMGETPPAGETELPTHGWGLMQVPAHTTVGATFAGGLDPRTIRITALIIAVVCGAMGLGWYLSTRRAKGAGKVAGDAVADEAGGADRLRELEDRYRRGEITSVEFQARRAALRGRGARAPAARGAPARAAGGQGGHGKATAGEPSRLLEEIHRLAVRKIDKAEGRLGKDVRLLARALEELLRNRGR